eukprot:TRINITY_DN4397_c0_g1_i1.p1 TRINITY_DN4397_c0_g1~~TRINITY_DN4397_c0_g1_i1.p1  ORF type:complete len:854 (+),score=90.71 TRINITY_DN4397_c0_g1_i1:83-2644(+)
MEEKPQQLSGTSKECAIPSALFAGVEGYVPSERAMAALDHDGAEDAHIIEEPRLQTVRRCGTEKLAVRDLMKGAHVRKATSWKASSGSLDSAALKRAVFSDQRWSNAMAALQKAYADVPDNVLVAAEICGLLREGAGAFGFWHLSHESLEGLTNQIMIGLERSAASVEEVASKFLTSDIGGGLTKSHDGSAINARTRINSATRRWVARKCHFSLDDVFLTQSAILFGVLLISIGYAYDVCFNKYPGSIDIFGRPLFVARAGGMAAVLWTALIYLTMAHFFLKSVFRKLARSCSLLSTIVDAHKEMHMFFGKAVFYTGLIHTAAHCIGTVPGIMKHSPEKINQLIGCANPETTPYYLGVKMDWLCHPTCPLPASTKGMTYEEIVFTTVPGLSGVSLLVLICVVAWTAARKSEKGKFERFWYMHEVAIVLWPILLFVHGSNGWLGVGFPLVVFVCGLPLLLRSADVVFRAIRYFRGRVTIKKARIRLAKGSKPFEGAMMFLQLSTPGVFWHPLRGSYARICCIDSSSFQWHPFTICSGSHSDTVDFIILGAGDWTQDLIKRVYSSRSEGQKPPTLVLDGPFLAPAEHALKREVFVAVGAGVGITPFLSLLGTLLSKVERGGTSKIQRLKVAHFFWSSRSVDEFLFAKTMFTKCLNNRDLSAKICFHLHVTHKEDGQDAAAYLFRETIRRQSKIDLATFKKSIEMNHGDVESGQNRDLEFGPRTPWCWMNGAKNDILWADSLLWHEGETESTTSIINFREKSGDTSGTEQFDNGILCRLDCYMPIMFGRPDFKQEIVAIGKANTDCDVHTYVCGNDLVVKSVEEACQEGNTVESIAAESEGRAIRRGYFTHFERFG